MKTEWQRLKYLWVPMLCLLLPPLSASAFYNPTAGRWLSRDPIEESGGKNLHGFAGNDPISKFDRDGRLFWGCAARRTCEEICALARKDPVVSRGSAAVVCDGERKCPCFFKLDYQPAGPLIQPGECPELDKIVIAHETKHIPQTTCKGCKGICRAPWDESHGEKDECGPRRDTIRDLEAAMPKASGKCKTAMGLLKVDEETFVATKCGG